MLNPDRGRGSWEKLPSMAMKWISPDSYRRLALSPQGRGNRCMRSNTCLPVMDTGRKWYKFCHWELTHKKRVSLFIDSELLDRARAYGLYLSKFMGNGLSIYFLSIEKGYSWKWGNTVCGGPDSNRRTPSGMDPESIAFNLARQPPLMLRAFLYDKYWF